MSQTLLIVLASLVMGVFGAFATWLFIDFSEVAGTFLKARKERKRLEAEAKALLAAESEETAEEGT